ncbi:hypothetical protein U3516DRAFT_755261 [Neocallimastix sp. 'constans']
MVIHLSLLHKAMDSHVHFSYEETSSGDITLMLMLTYTLLEFTSLNILKIMFNAI